MSAARDEAQAGVTTEVRLDKYDVLETGDPACAHAELRPDATGVARCGCGRTLRLVETVTAKERG